MIIDLHCDTISKLRDCRLGRIKASRDKLFRNDFHLDVERGDALLLCSDGLSNMMEEQEILFEVIHGVNKQNCCQRLLDIAKNRGAPDNVTSIFVLI